MIKEELRITGALSIEKNGTVILETTNLVVTAGKEWVAARMGGTGTVMTHMAVGSGTSAAVAGDSALGTESARVTLSPSGGTVSGSAVTYSATLGAGVGTGTVTEAGIFDAATSGNLLARTVFAEVNKGTSDTITITWTVTIS